MSAGTIDEMLKQYKALQEGKKRVFEAWNDGGAYGGSCWGGAGTSRWMDGCPYPPESSMRFTAVAFNSLVKYGDRSINSVDDDGRLHH